jgi:hypothetical protein
MARSRLITLTGLLVAIAFVAVTTGSAYAQRPIECLKVAGKTRGGNTEEGNLESGCATLRAGGQWVKARLVAPYGNNWCAEVETGLETGVKGYSSLLECLALRNAGTANARWVKVRGRPAGAGGGRTPSFATLPSVKTFKGMGAPSTLKAAAAGIATSCEEAVDAGEVTGMTTIGKLVIIFTGCQVTAESKTCTIKSVGAKEGEIVTHTLKGELGTTKSAEAASEVALLLLPESTKIWETLESTKCSPESKVTGSLAAEMLPISEKTAFGGLYFGVSSGKQAIQLVTVPSGVKEPELVAFTVTATEELEDGIEFTGEVEIV